MALAKTALEWVKVSFWPHRNSPQRQKTGIFWKLEFELINKEQLAYQ